MAKKKTIIIFLLAVFLLLSAYALLTSESVRDKSGLSLIQENKKTVLSPEIYQAKVKEIFGSYEKLAAADDSKAADALDLRNQLLAMKNLPAEYRDLHLNFVQALDRLADYLIDKDEQTKTAGRQIADKLKADYAWLSN